MMRERIDGWSAQLMVCEDGHSEVIAEPEPTTLVKCDSGHWTPEANYCSRCGTRLLPWTGDA